MLEGMVNVRAVTGELTIRSVGDILGADGAIQDVWVSGWKVIENRLVDAKILGQELSWGLRNPIVEVESRAICG